MEEVKIKQRNTAFDFVRLIAIFAIVCGHMYTFADFNQMLDRSRDISYFFSHFLKVLGLIENNVFFLIMGIYVKGTDTQNVIQKAGKLYATILIVSLLNFFIFSVLFKVPITIDLVLISFFPFNMNGYWFLSVYLLVLLLSPLINTVWHMIDKKYICVLFLTFFTIIVLIPSIFGKEKIITGGEYSVSFGILLFITGKLIDEYADVLKCKKFGGGYTLGFL